MDLSGKTSTVEEPLGASMLFHAATLATFFGASSAPTPLYRYYQDSFAISPVVITLIFAVYAFALLKALLFAGALSDHLGRRPVIFGALLLEMAAMVLFLVADGPAWLIAARIIQGIATGIAAASLGAALVDVDRGRGQLVNSVAPLLGMAVGALGTSALIQYGPFPLHLVFGLLLAIFLLEALLLWCTAETGATKPGVLGSFKPRIVVPPQVRRSLALVTPINVATWTLGGFYLSLVPSLVAATTGSRSPIVSGVVVTALMLAGAIAVLQRRTAPAHANLPFGVAVMTGGLAVVVAGVHLANVPLLVLGTLFSGAGFGTSFLGAVGSIMPLAKADERAGLLSAYYIQSYLAFSLPAILAGYLARTLGYAATADIFALAIILLSASGLAGLRRDRTRRGEPEPSADDPAASRTA